MKLNKLSHVSVKLAGKQTLNKSMDFTKTKLTMMKQKRTTNDTDNNLEILNKYNLEDFDFEPFEVDAK